MTLHQLLYESSGVVYRYDLETRQEENFSLVNAGGKWIYLMTDKGLTRKNMANGKEEFLTGEASFGDEVYLLDGKLFIMKRDGGIEEINENVIISAKRN